MPASYHEAREELPPRTIEMHRALLSLIEELEAVDWYAQRVAASRDEALKQVLTHSLEEEKEHACMTLEWIRRRDPCFDRLLREILFRSGPITAEPGASAESAENGKGDGSLGIGSLLPADAS